MGVVYLTDRQGWREAGSLADPKVFHPFLVLRFVRLPYRQIPLHTEETFGSVRKDKPRLIHFRVHRWLD